MNHVQWVELYRPTKLEDCIIPKHLKETFQSYIDKDVLQNILLTGSAGMGKTTVAKVLCEQMNMEMLYVDGSNEGKLIDTLRTKITQFASTVSFNGKRKVVLLDEADMLPEAVQTALRSFIELYSQNCAFIFTCNFEHKIFEPLRDSRLVQIEFKFPEDERQTLCFQFYKRLKGILKQNNIPFDDNSIIEMINRHYPDWRSLLNHIQSYSHRGQIDSGILSAGGSSDVAELIGFLKTKNYREMRKWVPTNNPDMARLASTLYDNAYELLEPQSIPELTMILNEHQVKHTTALVPEINMVAMLTVLMTSMHWK